MSTDYNYDDEGQFFPYFVLTILGLILIPLTYSSFAPSKKPGTSKTPLVKDANYTLPKNETVEAARRRQAKKERRIKRFIALTLGWAGFGFMCYLIATTKTAAANIWDPYEILGISKSLDEKAIKSVYKKLSLKHHPDKAKPGPNETIEDLNEKFVEITKAYKTLTDEEVRNNYIQFGHPDGKQSFSIGIALPRWIVSEGNTYYVLAIYGLLLGILLPYTVGKWWYGTRRRTKDGVMTESAGKLFKEYDDQATQEKLVYVLTSGEEMKELVTGEREKEWNNGEDATVERKVAQAGLYKDDIEALSQLEGWRRRALGLFWAYLYRVDLGNDKLENAKLETAPAAMLLNKSFHAICLAFGNLGPLLTSMRLSQRIIQAIPPGHSPLLQIPHFTPALVSHIEKQGERNHWSVQRLMSLPEDQRKKLCTGKGRLTPAQYTNAMIFGHSFPVVHVEAAFFKVTGEKFITPSSLVQFVVKMRIIPPGSTPPPVDPKDLNDEDPDETDVEALLGRKDKFGAAEDEAKPGEGSKDLPLAHAPFYPRDYHPCLNIFLADSRQGKLVVPPQAIRSFDRSPDNFAVVTAKMQFQAPPNPGEYSFQMMVVSDSYIGLDLQRPVQLVVSDPSKVERIEEIDDISEPDEDTIAGQMTAMRGGGAPLKKKKAANDSDSEDESDTDGEVAEVSETDTETDTEDES